MLNKTLEGFWYVSRASCLSWPCDSPEHGRLTACVVVPHHRLDKYEQGFDAAHADCHQCDDWKAILVVHCRTCPRALCRDCCEVCDTPLRLDV